MIANHVVTEPTVNPLKELGISPFSVVVHLVGLDGGAIYRLLAVLVKFPNLVIMVGFVLKTL